MIVELVVGIGLLIAGWYGRDIVDGLAAAAARRRRDTAATVLRDQGAEWLIDYYLKAGAAPSLFALETGRRIPYLTRGDWYYPSDKFAASTLEVVPHRSAVDVDPKAIERRRTQGQRIWDDQVLSLSGINDRGTSSRIMLGSCGYFQYVTTAEAMTRELVASIRRGRSTPFRDKNASSIEHLEQGRLDAQIAGFTTALVLRIDGRPCVLVQRRSLETGVGGGSLSVVPACVANTSQVASATGLDLARHLFYIELLEELYDHEELITTMRRPSLDWIHDTWPVDRLETALGTDFEFKWLGFGFDATTGEFHQAFVARVDSEDLSSELVRQMEASWEVQDVEIHQLNDSTFLNLISSTEMYPTSAFTLTLAREYMRDHPMT